MYTRLIQGYEAMDPDLQAASASAARQMRLMVGAKGRFLLATFKNQLNF